MGKEISDERHDGKLREYADAHIPRVVHQMAKVFELDRHAHAEHDDPQEKRHLRRNPRERRGKDRTRRADEDDEPDHVLDDEAADVLQMDSSHQKSLPAKRQKGQNTCKTVTAMYHVRCNLVRNLAVSVPRDLSRCLPLRYSFVAGHKACGRRSHLHGKYSEVRFP